MCQPIQNAFLRENKAMRIAHVVEACGGGVARHVVDLGIGLIQRGHHVSIVYAPSRSEPSFLDELNYMASIGANIQALPMERALGLADFSSWWKLIHWFSDQPKFDVIHGHSSKAGALVRLLPKGIHGARIYTSHALRTMDPTLNQFSRTFYGTVERFLTNRREHVLIAGSTQEAEAAKSIGIALSRIHIVPNGINASALPGREQVRTKLRITKKAPVIGFVGRLVKQKAPERAIRALAEVSRRDVCLVMLGSGDMEPFIRSLSKDLGVGDRVYIRNGYDGRSCMPAFDALIVPSRYESMGYVFLEAASAKIPIISTPVGIARDVIRNGGNGTIVPNNDDPIPFARAIEYWIENNRLREDDIYPYTANTMIQHTIDVYRSALHKNICN